MEIALVLIAVFAVLVAVMAVVWAVRRPAPVVPGQPVAPLFDELYQSVSSGDEARIVIETCSKDDYRESLDKELAVLAGEEIWRAGKQVRSLRPRA